MAEEVPLRLHYSAELEQLSLQAEMMGVLVDENLERMRDVLRTGDLVLAERAISADDTIDDMNVSLTERCYELLRREAPVAGDLRLIVSVLRVTSEFERIGDLSLRVCKLAPEHRLLTLAPRSFDILLTMADDALHRFREALRAWSAMDEALAEQVANEVRVNFSTQQLVESMLSYDGPEAVPAALNTLVAGQALDRITDHAAILGARVRYLITGDPTHLAAEVR
ncbi:phosphate signaling complex protein PhoU [Rhabdothermincola salaria]|uniref:phosphate signaling complex protein PhoU n=1 Tax=Rhabdothermincola salaria TaxID=2903142 RepID=UPI001E344143|nr:phosphate signaling complex protein PhoU [Rhabdothermincola salaria]MCD9625593.1 phosphate signaling complex protein PhoU [Rhabdothermincola salaria]